ncbi:phosphate ABC transporter permease PstA [Minwuia sp.]|uniref:phosphate ABC transporter permease PstA n=1 Tax=Minwuia sp. TaxID=2493630 RepID=UPI003A954CE2
MTAQTPNAEGIERQNTAELVRSGLARRYAAERRFIWYGRAAIAVALMFLIVLIVSVVAQGWSAVLQTKINLTIPLPVEKVSPSGNLTEDELRGTDYNGIIKQALRDRFPEVTNRKEKRALYDLISQGASFELRDMVMEDPSLVGRTVDVWLTASDDVDQLIKGAIDRDVPEEQRIVKNNQLTWIEDLEASESIETHFNTRFFTAGDSREPEMAGIWGAALGSFFTLMVTLVLAFPLGVTTAVYLEEFAPKNRWTDLIEVNINNLAAVPSIIFGLLGLAVFLQVFGLPRSAPIAGGVVLALMTLPTIIIASRAALKSVPPSIREAALGVGASRLQTVTHHVLPLAMPGMLTGSIIGMAQALGETAPLIMIGMVAFIVDLPSSPFDPSTVLPVQIYIWADSPERAFVERTSAGIIVLLIFLVLMNLSAVMLRKRFEKRW